MTIAKRFCVLALLLDVMVGLGTFIGIGFGCAFDNMFAAFLLIQALIISSFVVMLIGYNQKNESAGRKTCAAGLLLFVLAMASSAWGFNFKAHGVWQPYVGLQAERVATVQLGWDGQPMEAEDAQRVLELMRQVKVQNPAMDGEWAAYPDDFNRDESNFFMVGMAGGERTSLGVSDGYYLHGGNCFKAANPEVGAALQSLYAELAEKYAPADTQLAAE